MGVQPLTGIWTFVRTVELGGLSAAARALGRTPSSVSKSLRLLEERLGARLLHRTTRRVQPTEAGLELYRRCRPLFEAFGEAEDAVRERRTELAGPIRVTATPTLGRARLVPALVAFVRRHPDVRLDLHLTAHRVDLAEEAIDVAVREGRLADSRLVATRLGTFGIVLCASPAYLARRGTPRTPADLGGHEMLAVPAMVDPDGLAIDARRFRLPPGGTFAATARFVVNDLATVADLARADCGIAALPAYLVEEDLAAGRLCRILPTLPLPEFPVTALTLDRRHQPRRTRALLEFLTEWFAGPPPSRRAVRRDRSRPSGSRTPRGAPSGASRPSRRGSR